MEQERTTEPPKNLVLIGFMGTGKSTLGRLCAAQLGYAFSDSDSEIEARTGCTIAELFTYEGEAQFRQRERDVIADLAATSGLVIATGGGAPLDPLNAARLRASGLVVLLTAPPEIILRRTGNGRSRPLLASAPDPRARIVELLAERQPRYRAVAHCHVDTGGAHTRDIVPRIIMLYQLAQG